MVKLGLVIVFLIAIVGCSPTISKEAAQVAFHSTISQLLKDCKKLGPVNVEYKVKLHLSREANEEQVKGDMRQMAFDKYGADNLVFINSERVGSRFDRKPDFIYGQGVAFKCYK